MAFGTRRLARGRNQNKIGFNHILLQRGRRLREVFQCGIPNVLLLRVSGLLEGRVVGSKLESFTITQARRSFLSRRSEVCNTIKTRQSRLGKKFKSEILRRIKAKVWKSPLPSSRRRADVQRFGRNRRAIIIARGRRAGAKILQILDPVDICVPRRSM
jgi:hypothetical protein